MSKWNSSSPPPLEQLRMFSSHIGGDNFIDYEICEELSNLLDNKDIILVGPAPNIKGKGMGEFIDSFDVVIRPGQLTKIPQSEILDYGSKTTIISHSFNIWEKKIALENIDFLKTLDYVIGCMVCCYEKYTGSLDIHHLDPKIKYKNFSCMRGWCKERILAEIEKCVLLCRNCHAEVHAGLIDLNDVI